MNYSSLDSGYSENQKLRVTELVGKIVSRGEAISAGRVIPADDDLVIGEGRRLSLAVLFLDICSSSSRPAETPRDQEMQLRVLTLFFSEMVRVAEDYGGVVEKNTGDGLMAYFEDGGGEPSAPGCTRALSSALTMLYVNQHAINPVLRATPVPEIHFRIGIDYGNVTIARMGRSRGFNSLVAIGTRANVANKMLRVAGQDEILVGESVFRALPVVRQQYCILKTLDSGWYYIATGAPYPLYEYTGRWIN